MGALSVFVIGMFFCLTLRRTGNLWFAVGLHASFDWGETFLFSVPNSGIVASGHLLNSSFHGPVWLTGGTVGPEGSVMAFVVVALAAVIFSRVFRRGKRRNRVSATWGSALPCYRTVYRQKPASSFRAAVWNPSGSFFLCAMQRQRDSSRPKTQALGMTPLELQRQTSVENELFHDDAEEFLFAGAE